jgi:hypothetical protein
LDVASVDCPVFSGQNLVVWEANPSGGFSNLMRRNPRVVRGFALFCASTGTYVPN